MKIKCLRNMLINGEAHVAGDVVEVEQPVALDLINIGKAQPYDEKSLTNRAVGLTKKSAASLVKRNTKK